MAEEGQRVTEFEPDIGTDGLIRVDGVVIGGLEQGFICATKDRDRMRSARRGSDLVGWNVLRLAEKLADRMVHSER